MKQFPVAVVIDDAENLDGPLLQQFVGGLTNPAESRVLVVVACDPKHPNHAIVKKNELLNAARRIQSVDVLGSMDIDHRLEPIRAKTIDWPAVAVDRLASRTTNFAQIFDVLELGGSSDISASANAVTDVDELITAAIPTKATAELAILSMLGGLVHVATYDALRRDLGLSPDRLPPEIEVSKYIVRLAERSDGGLSAGTVASMLSAANRVTIVNRIVPLTVGTVETMDGPNKCGTSSFRSWTCGRVADAESSGSRTLRVASGELADQTTSGNRRSADRHLRRAWRLADRARFWAGTPRFANRGCRC